MAYDAATAERARKLLAGRAAVVEKELMGELLLHGEWQPVLFWQRQRRASDPHQPPGAGTPGPPHKPAPLASSKVQLTLGVSVEEQRDLQVAACAQHLHRDRVTLLRHGEVDARLPKR